MSYAATYPPQASPAAVDQPRRPAAVQLAAVLLLVMAFVGLAYAIVTLAVTPGVIDRFRSGAGPAGSTGVDGYVTVVWMFAAIGTVLAVVLFALYIVLALGLRRGSSGSRVATLVLCGLGMLFGCGSGIAVGAQKAGEGTPGTLGFALSEAYPQSWISLNVGLVIAQVVGYLIVILLLAFGSGSYFRKADDPSQRNPSYVALPTYGSANAYAQPVSGAPGHHPAAAFPPAPAPQGGPAPYGASGAAQSPYGASGAAQSPYGASGAAQSPYGASGAAQPPYGAPVAPQSPHPGAPMPTAEDQAFWSRPAPAPSAPASVAPSPEPGSHLASDEAWSQEPATLPPAASAPTPVAPPYDEPDRPADPSNGEKPV
jgi:hypothetical protein